jgi:hypothetical protein
MYRVYFEHEVLNSAPTTKNNGGVLVADFLSLLSQKPEIARINQTKHR